MNENLQKFVDGLRNRLNEYKVKSGLTYFEKFDVIVKEKRKFFRIDSVQIPESIAGTSIRAFVNKETGEIFKPASYKTPAKHARGNINSAQNGMEAIDPHGFVYYLR